MTLDQARAIACNDRLIVVTAGAGAGKTAVLTGRVERLLRDGIWPTRILVVTFTRAAATELRERLAERLDKRALGGLRVQTIHAWCLGMLRDNPAPAGLRENFSIYDAVDVEDIQRQILADLCIKQKTWKGATSSAHPDQAWGLAEEYKRRLKSWNATDFDGLLSGAELVLRDRPEVTPGGLHILVDEAQDTAPIPWRLFELLKPASLFVVGDPRQAIYGFQGARIEEMQALQARATTIVLRENFRSRPHIVVAANAISRQMTPAQPDMAAMRATSGVVVELSAASVAHAVQRLLYDDDGAGDAPAPSDVAILGRTWAALEPVADALRALGIKAELATPARDPWASAGARVVLQGLRAICNDSDGHSARGLLSEITDSDRVAALRAVALRSGLSLLAVDEALAIAVRSVRADLADAFQAASRLIESLGLVQLYRYTGRTSKAADVVAALGLIGQWHSDGRGSSVRDLLDWLLQRDLQERAQEASGDGVYLGTIHSAKGLEWPTVILLDWTPRGDEQEELRCRYVGMTRARDRLWLVRCDDANKE